MKTGIIYKATSPSGKSYIGQTISSLKNRKLRHFYDSKKYDYAFSRAIKKYGIDNFEWIIIYNNVKQNILNISEICAIYTYGTYYNGYNSTFGGESIIGYRYSDEQKLKMSNSRLGHKNHMYGKHHTIESKEKMSTRQKGKNNSFYGKKHSKETKEKLLKAGLGRKHTEESKEKMSLKQRGKNHPMYGKHHTSGTKENISIKNGGKLFEMQKNGKLIARFINIRECSRKFNLQRSNVSACLHGRQKTHKGYSFVFVGQK